ncbi:hypothetical protein E2562_026920 [Oryza meyeriana var. granulata]|uniref:Uncharacterized protein n=1 Tax=Oryza meyeriana var. granulata TaxID=110450 RepID=A0A6G1CTG9_9ORYZ|nr:hypothetical protein E2562_026920 [Oryza meyeriana var. granulata]
MTDEQWRTLVAKWSSAKNMSTMQAMMEEPVAEGEAPRTSAEVVAKVLSQESSNTTFLKNTGIESSSKKSEEIDALKKKVYVADEALSEIKRNFAEFKQHQDENNGFFDASMRYHGRQPIVF